MSYRINLHEHILPNGLRVIIIPNFKSPVINITVGYKVGSKDDSFAHKGFAHFFEHLMFDGSAHVGRGEFDLYCSRAGGQFNAYTAYDQTIYHETLPAHQAELALWLESDRMLQFGVQQIGLDTQKKVVLEEINQTVENQPYGRWRIEQAKGAYAPECSYSWEVLGEKEHIASADMEQVSAFFSMYYRPDNACLVLSGAIQADKGLELAEKYFGDIRRGEQPVKRHEFHPSMKRTGDFTMTDAVPLPAVFVSFHYPGFIDDSSICAEFIASIMGEGRSSRLYTSLVRNKQIASSVFCFADAREHSSLLTFSATAADASISAGQLKDMLLQEILESINKAFTPLEMQKTMNVAATGIAQNLQTNAGIADLVAQQTLFWNDPGRVNILLDKVKQVKSADLQEFAAQYIRPENMVSVSVIPA
jgi:predicted Zn-dependent peptidase